MNRLTGGRSRHRARQLIAGVAAAALAAFTATSGQAQELLVTPTPVTPSDVSVTTVADADCVQQLDDEIIALQITATVADGVALGAEAVGAVEPTGAVEATAIGGQIAALVFATAAQGLEQDLIIQDVPECDTTFAGTVEVTAGGVNVSGDSIFQDNLGVVGDAEVGGTLEVFGDTTIDANLDVTGDATVGGSLDVTSDASVGGNFAVTGNTDLNGDLEVQGNTVLQGTLDLASDLIVGVNLEVNVD